MGMDAQAFDGLSFTEDMAWSLEILSVLPETPTLLRLDAHAAQVFPEGQPQLLTGSVRPND